jgi:thiosulfate/3-mercaptopyruvate sulfurtransferase
VRPAALPGDAGNLPQSPPQRHEAGFPADRQLRRDVLELAFSAQYAAGSGCDRCQQPRLRLDAATIHEAAVPGHHEPGICSGGRNAEQATHGRGPVEREGVLERGRGALLQQIPGERNVRVGYQYEEVAVGMAAAKEADLDTAAAQVEHRAMAAHRYRGRRDPHRGNLRRAVRQPSDGGPAHVLAGIAQCRDAPPVAVDGGIRERRVAERVVEVRMRVHDVANRDAREPPRVGRELDALLLGRPRVHEQRLAVTGDEPDVQVEPGVPPPEHAGLQLLPCAHVSYSPPMTLISPDELAARLGDPALRVVDVRWYLGQPGRGRAAYDQGHVPGALFLDLDDDLSAHGGPGRHPLPDPAAFAARLGEFGIGSRHTVVAYDDAGGWVAARLWWMLDNLGHESAAVLDGGLPAWLAAGHPITTATPGWPPARLDVAERWTRVVDRDEVRGRLGSIVLLDARGGARYRGETEPIDPVAGHIPTAVSAPYESNLGPDGRFLPPDELARRFRALAADGPESADVVTSCGSGTSACHHALAMRVAGLPDPLLYVGSWSDWSTAGYPVATGAAPGDPPHAPAASAVGRRPSGVVDGSTS